MHIDFLIVGQGISGTWLSYYLQKEGKSFIVIDDNNPSASSRLAAGLINPVTGRRHSTTWMAGKLLPFVKEAYKELGDFLEEETITHTSIIDLFPSPQMRLSFMEGIDAKNPYMRSFPEQNHFNGSMRYDFGCGEIAPVYITHLDTILPAWRSFLQKNNKLLDEEFDRSKLIIEHSQVRYGEITAEKIIFCDGHKGSGHPYFTNLPFAASKGELLLVEIPGLNRNHVYKKNFLVVPVGKQDLFWIGSNYAWNVENDNPTKEFRVKTEEALLSWFKLPFRVLDHRAGIRPATLERRPFVGIHPHFPSIAILNGMGTKGCSLAPWFAKELVDHLLYEKQITPEASISRFRKILARV